MEIRLTSVNNAKDMSPQSCTMLWADLMTLFAEQANISRPISDKTAFLLPALYPTVYGDGSVGKVKSNVIGYGAWTEVDIDHVMTLDELRAFYIDHELDGCVFTTTSHTAEDPRVRGVFLLNREIDPSEFDEFWHALNAMFDGKLDPQTKNINRIYYVPAKWNDLSQFERITGKPLDVDFLIEQHPHANHDQAIPTEVVRSKIQAVRDKLAVDGTAWTPATAITDKMISRFHSRKEGGRLFGLEVSIAKRALWMGYPIAAHEVEAIALAFDRTTTGKKRQDTAREALHALEIAEAAYAVACVEDDQQVAAAPDKREQHWVKPLAEYEVNALNAPCGAGKTYQMLSNIVMKGGRWVYACDMVKNIKEREDEFRQLALKYNKFGFQVHMAYYDASTPVAKQVKAIMDGLYSRNVIIFITHAALQILDASIFIGFSLVIDEAYEVISKFERKWNCNIELADRYFEVVDTNSDYYQITSTPEGSALVNANKFDDINDTFEDLLRVLSGQYTSLWVMKNEWAKRSESKICFWVVSSPNFIECFSEVWLIGDELKCSPIYLVWYLQHKVRFKFHEVSNQRKRAVELSQRGTIYYFTEKRQASTNQFRKGDSPLLAISKWIIANFKDDAFYYAYNETKGHIIADIEEECKRAEKISLKATGINTLQHHTMCIWLGSMKLSAQEKALMETVFDIEHDTQVRWREYNPLYQFVMRSALRSYTNDARVSIFVFDKYQADYLHERTGMPVEHVPGVVSVDAVSTGGRPALGARPMSSTERSRASRARKKAEAGEP